MRNHLRSFGRLRQPSIPTIAIVVVGRLDDFPVGIRVASVLGRWGILQWQHKDLIVSRSDFFTRALNGKWKEGNDNVVKLPEDEPEIFWLYIQLLYSGKNEKALLFVAFADTYVDTSGAEIVLS